MCTRVCVCVCVCVVCVCACVRACMRACVHVSFKFFSIPVLPYKGSVIILCHSVVSGVIPWGINQLVEEDVWVRCQKSTVGIESFNGSIL